MIVFFFFGLGCGGRGGGLVWLSWAGLGKGWAGFPFGLGMSFVGKAVFIAWNGRDVPVGHWLWRRRSWSWFATG